MTGDYGSGYGSAIHTQSLTTSFINTGNINLSTDFNNKSTIKLKITASNSSLRNLRIDDLILSGTASSSNSITTGTVSSTPFCINATNGISGTVAYTSTGTYSGATFTAYLSDATGSFTLPTNIGTASVTGTDPSGNINITIPAGTPSGTGYKIRIDCNTPAVTGTTSLAFEIVNGANNVSNPTATPNDKQVMLTWTNPTGCYDEIMVIAKTSTITGTPSGDGTAYSHNLNYGTGTPFDGGYVVYKGVVSPETITSLTNGTNYYFKFFTRKGTDWSTGIEINSTPNLNTDVFRTKATGNWNSTSTWESSPDGTTFVNATTTPGPNNTVYVQSGHTVTLTQNESCNDLHISTGTTSATNGSEGVVALTSYTLQIYGKLRCYYSSVGDVPGTTTNSVGTGPITKSSGSNGRIKFVGVSRNILNSGEWAASNTGSTSTFGIEIALNSGETATMQTSIKASTWIISSGILNTGDNRIAVDIGGTTGSDVIINAGATVISSAYGSGTSAVVSRTGSSVGGVFTLNGTLILLGNAPTIGMSTINLNGSVEYGLEGDQTFLTAIYSGASPNVYNNLIISGSSTKSLIGNTTVNGVLTLTSGKLVTASDKKLILGTSATITGGSSTSFIDGPLDLNTNSTDQKTVHVGSGTNYRTVGVKPETADATTYSIQFNNFAYSDTVTFTAPLVKVSTREHYIISRTSGIANAKVTISWDSLAGITNLGNLQVGRWNSSSWVDAGRTSFTGNERNGTITSGIISSFSPFAIASTSDQPLPVHLSSFTSSASRRNINLNWTTATENNNSGFDVERKGMNESNWMKAGYVQGSGNSNSTKNYSFTDRGLQTGKYQYRLKQIDFNGNYEYFDLNGYVEVGVPNKYDISQNYPNPFNPVTKIDYDLPFDSKVSLRIYDVTGREVKSLFSGDMKAGYYTQMFDASSLSSGIYFYRIAANSLSGNFVMTKKMALIK